MATFKLSINRGQKAEDAVVAAGSSISGNDGVELNVDRTNMTQTELIVALDELKRRILQSPFPIPTS